MASADARVRIVFASPDAPAIDICLNGSSDVTHLDYAQASKTIDSKPGALTLKVLGRLPGTARPVVDGPPYITLAGGGAYEVLAVNNVGTVEPLVAPRETSTVFKSGVRLQVVQAAGQTVR